VLCGLLHDIGKGLPGDHSTVGAPIAADVAGRSASARRRRLVEKVVRLHLLLPDTATRRDLSDPQTIATVAACRRRRLDPRAAARPGPRRRRRDRPRRLVAWKGRLIADLVRHVERALDTGVVAPPPSPAAALPVPARLPAVQLEVDSVSVTAKDRRGLLAAVAGCLSLHRLDVVTADTLSVDGLARMVCAVQPRYGGELDREAIVSDLRRAVTGDLPVAERLVQEAARQGRLTDADIDATAREIRLALLEADVALPVVKDVHRAPQGAGRGAEVSQALNPAQQVIKIVNEELVTSSAARPGGCSSPRTRRP
jgi:[protein-PII] uridylyltransferase